MLVEWVKIAFYDQWRIFRLRCCIIKNLSICHNVLRQDGKQMQQYSSVVNNVPLSKFCL